MADQPPPISEHLWNHRIHQRWAAEDLTFWRLAFFPKYDPKQILPKLNNAMRDLHVTSYAIYEMFGLFDLFVRAWLPSHAIERVDQTLNEVLAAESMQLCEGFTVSRLIRHWAWDDGKGGLHEPDAAILKESWSDETIAKIERGEISDEERHVLANVQHVIRPLDHGDGIKFIIVVTSSAYSPTFNARVRLSQGLLDILDRSKISEPSLYEGSGFGQFILMGRVAIEDYFVLRQLATEINATGIQDTARPYTFVSARPNLVHYADRLPSSTSEAPKAPSVEQLLARGEGLHVEVKGSARLNWRRYLGSGSLIAEDAVLNDGLLKAIVGMLNADGGHIVVGALERSAHFGEEVADAHPALTNFPRRGEYICVGVNDEYDARGWDRYRLRLLEAVSSRIDPPPAGSLGLSRQVIDGRDMCVVSVKPTTATWYYRYLGESQPMMFYVREDGRTVAYAGSRADAYKRANERG